MEIVFYNILYSYYKEYVSFEDFRLHFMSYESYKNYENPSNKDYEKLIYADDIKNIKLLESQQNIESNKLDEINDLCNSSKS